MYGQLTRAQGRDAIRIKMGQIPPIYDGSAGAAGAQPTRWPRPLNAELNIFIDEAVAWFSTKLDLGSDPLPVSFPVPAQTADGPFVLRLQNLAPFGSVTSIRYVSWRESGGTAQMLDPVSQEEMDRDNVVLEESAVGTPRRFLVSGGNLLIDPAPEAAGELLIRSGSVLWREAATVDQEVCDIFDTDHFPYLWAKAAELCALQFPAEAEMQKRLPAFMATVREGLADMRWFFLRRNMGERGNMTAGTTRVPGYGYR